MLKRFLRRIFAGEAPMKSNNEDLATLLSNSAVRTKEEIEKMLPNSGTLLIKLKSGQVASIVIPDLPGFERSVLSKWYYKVGDVVKDGDILCEIENEVYMMDVESLYEGEIIWRYEGRERLMPGTEICKIRGINN